MSKATRTGVLIAIIVIAIVFVALLVRSHGKSTHSAGPTTSTNSPGSTGPGTTTAPTSPGTTGPTTRPPSTAWLHTTSTTIVNSGGQRVQLTGLNVSGMESSNPQGTSLAPASIVAGSCNDGWKQLTSTEVDQIASYGFHSVRLPIAWANLEPRAPVQGQNASLQHTWNTQYVAALDSEMSLFAAHHIQVILDMHQFTWSYAFRSSSTSNNAGCPGSGMPGWLNPGAASETAQSAECAFLAGQTEAGVPGSAWDDFIAASTYIDGHYANDPTVVGLDLINEPYCTGANLDAFYDRVVPAVRAVDGKALLIVEDYEVPGKYEVTSLPSGPNVVFSIHLHQDYWQQPSPGQSPEPDSGQTVLTDNEQRATAWGVPLYLGEFYAFDGTLDQSKTRQPDANWQVDTSTLLTYCRQHDISWSYWAWIHLQPKALTPALPVLAHGAAIS